MPSVLTLLLSAAAMVGAVPPPVWLWPLDGPREIAHPYVAPLSPYGRGHRGVDLASREGAVVRAPAEGVVHFAGFVVDRPVISLRHADGALSSFEPVESGLARGDRVQAGEEIGTLLAGHCDEPCLHLGVRHLGQYISPLKYLGGIPHPVLLPTRRYDAFGP